MFLCKKYDIYAKNKTILLPLQQYLLYHLNMKGKIFTLIAASLAVGGNALAGGLLTNTNQNVAFNRNFAREATIGIDGVYSNPAGVVFLDKGFHLSFNVQNIYQTRTIKSTMTVPSLQGTPFYEPFRLNGASADGSKTYVGKASVPIFPTLQAAYNTDRWSFQLGMGLVGGGGKASFNDGLGSFERPISMIPAALYSASEQFRTQTPAYSFSSYMNGQQYIFGLQIGAAYKINENLAVYGGIRANYVLNKYEGNIVNIMANVAGQNVNLNNFFASQAQALKDQAQNLRTQRAGVEAQITQLNGAIVATQARINATTDNDSRKALEATLSGYQQNLAAAQAGVARIDAGIPQLEAGAAQMEEQQNNVKDKYLESTQNGWGITPIIGIHAKLGKWNVAGRMEFNTHLNIQNDTKRDDTGMFKHGVNTPSDVPGLLALGAQYEVVPQVRVMAGWHYYFDKSAKMDKDKQKLLKSNTNEFLAGAEWDITDKILVSAGTQITRYGLGNGAYLSDMSFVTSSYSLGFGAKFKVTKNLAVNVAYFFTDYEHFDKQYSDNIRGVEVQNTDNFTRTSKSFGVGVDLNF